MIKTVYVGHRINFLTKQSSDMNKNWVAIGIYEGFLEFQMQQYLKPTITIRSRYLCYGASTY